MQHFYINPKIFESLEGGDFVPVYFDASGYMNERFYNMRTSSKIPDRKDVNGKDLYVVRLFNTNKTNESLIAVVGHEMTKGKEYNGKISFTDRHFHKLTVYKVEKPKEKDCYGRS